MSRLEAEAAPLVLTGAQEAAVERIVAAIGSGARFLLYGATGSGKTEVYLRACAAALERDRTAIVLVPEIALTPQALARFRARFGDIVACLHSSLSEAERRDERERIAAGEARIVVGARSAIFAPVERLGVVCIDEEHDPSYKHESDPRYDARTVAVQRAALDGAVAIFGSATPRPESWALLERIELGGRIAGALPPVRVVDLRREQGYPLSAPLLAGLGRIADEGGKAILLLNRRGVAPALHCRGCGSNRALPLVRRLARRSTRIAACIATTAESRRRRRDSVRRAGRPSWPGSALARNGSSASWPRACPSWRSSGSTPTRRQTRATTSGSSRGSRPRIAPSCSAPRWWRRATISRGSASPPCSTRTPGC